MRKRIMAGAVEEIREKGVKFTMSDLAKRLGVSKRSLYEHFDSKENLVCAIIEALLENIQKQRLAIMADGSLNYQEKLQKVLTVQPILFSPIEAHAYGEIKRFLHAQSEQLEQIMRKNWAIVEEFLKLGIESGQIRSIYIPIIEIMIKGTMHEMVDYRFLADHNISLIQAQDSMIDILLHGVFS